MKTLITLSFFIYVSSICFGQKLYYPTMTSAFMSNTLNNVSLISSIGEAAPVSELNIGSNVLTQGYLQYQVKTTSHVVNLNGKIEVSLFPNPTSKTINIDLKESGYGLIEFTIESATGQIILNKQTQRAKGNHQLFSFDVESLASANYIVTISYLDDPIFKPISIKFVKH